VSLPWAVAFTLGLGAFVAFVAPVILGGGGSRPAAVVGAAMAAALVVALAVLRRRHGALDASVAGSEHRAAEWQRYAEGLERRVEAQEQARHAQSLAVLCGEWPPAAAPVPVAPTRPEPVGALPGSLPQRHSRRDDLMPGGHDVSASAEPAPPAQTPQQAGAWLAAYLQPPAGGPAAAAPAEAGPAPGRPSQTER
jgi:hypothetical protein